MRVDIQALTINTHSNCWEILTGQSAAKYCGLKNYIA
ncbi:hypothetical protein YTXLTZUM_CDS0210 [Enterococcus phage VRE9_3]